MKVLIIIFIFFITLLGGSVVLSGYMRGLEEPTHNVLIATKEKPKAKTIMGGEIPPSSFN